MILGNAINKRITLEKVKNYAHLGTTLTEKGDEEEEFKARMMQRMKCVGSLRLIMCAKEVSRTTKLRVYKTAISSSVLDGRDIKEEEKESL